MIATVPGFVKWIFKNRIWEGPADEKAIYLTFDDGPIPEVTPWVLDQLKSFNAKATFFCIGENVQKHPEIFKKIIAEGHKVGNHTFNHLNGWKTSTPEYVLNTLKARQIIEKNIPGKEPAKNALFRPPYGRIKSKQVRELQKRDFRIIMWSILSMDYKGITPEKCFQNVIDHARPGSVIVFHDSFKAQKNLTKVLPRVLEHFSVLGYSFKSL
ncbi:Peptidoglycan/xylan/chitin deacetylase, PgdA/CDA1 family [Salinimicrobium sediminis]|uniref:Peptidoglycan/xylan/chitin deacetylase, PgdA/CDA1 family n=1 Tax=Salinimicrobium sediminis TaxID=1343891 RepID=A0A285X5R4_9FLAO|nr:polysaccharide deacetylase family protein [Salinimicrobium sediminis]SOC79749.1 Peptidoglycan/xylan/chitin deacetylase, PgdA/CDA1 family [Salinimicrobium sediminis]